MGDKFWAVWRMAGGFPPKKRHETKESAIAEANRLARQEEEEYYVLEVVGVVRPVQLPVEYEDL